VPDELDQVGAELSAYLDGELPPERAAEVERRLSESADYRQRLEELRGVCETLGRLPRLKAPEGLLGALRRQAERRMLLGEARVGGSTARAVKLFVRLTAAAAVLGVCVLTGWRFGSKPAGGPASVATTGPARVPAVAVAADNQQRKETAGALPAGPGMTGVDELSALTARRLRAGGERAAGANLTAKAAPGAQSPPQPQLGRTVNGGLVPVVEVLLRPADEAQYQAACALLASIGAEGSKPASPVAQEAGPERGATRTEPAQLVRLMRQADLAGFVGALSQRVTRRVYVQPESLEYIAPERAGSGFREAAFVPVLDESALQSMQAVLDRVWELRRAQARRLVTVRVILLPPEGSGAEP